MLTEFKKNNNMSVNNYVLSLDFTTHALTDIFIRLLGYAILRVLTVRFSK